MCGIFGSTRHLSDVDLQDVGKLLNHRGPDSHGQIKLPCVNGILSLLHTRLAVQDLSANGHQPMQSADQRWWVVFNGEIYNHLEMRKSLSNQFKGSSDTETLVEHIAAFGLEATLDALNGMFAFCAYDSHEMQLHLVRDQFGIKPLYYSLNGAALSFASELKALLRVEPESRNLNRTALGTFLQLRYNPSEETLLDGIKRLPPGHCLTIELGNGAHTLRRYLRPTTERFEGSIQDARDTYGRYLREAVERQLIADVPVGVLLSGGVDSAIIAAMARESSRELSSFTVGFGEGYRDCELTDAAETAQILGIPHHQVTVGADDLLASLPNIVSSMEEPLGTTSILPMWYLTQKARQHVTVALTGQGNDEPWGGYRRYQMELLLNKLPLLKGAAFKVPESVVQRFNSEAARRGLRCLGYPDAAERFSRAYSLFSDAEIRRLLPDMASDPQAYIRDWLDWLPESADLSDADRMMRVDTRMNLADDLLLYGDKISMACALETRVPMLDVPLVQFIESLPLHFRTSLRQTKVVHKALAENYLPKAIVHRRKKGFQVPFCQWSRTVWRQAIEEQLLDPGLRIFEYLSYQGVSEIWQAHVHARRDYSKQIFALWTLSLWCEEYL